MACQLTSRAQHPVDAQRTLSEDSPLTSWKCCLMRSTEDLLRGAMQGRSQQCHLCMTIGTSKSAIDYIVKGYTSDDYAVSHVRFWEDLRGGPASRGGRSDTVTLIVKAIVSNKKQGGLREHPLHTHAGRCGHRALFKKLRHSNFLDMVLPMH